MRRITALVVAIVAFLATSSVGAQATQLAKVVRPKCTLAGVHFDSKSNRVWASKAYCRAGKKRVRAHLRHVVQLFDSERWSCYTKPIIGSSTVKLNPPGNFKVTLTVYTRWKGRIIKEGRTIWVSLGSDQVMCGRPGDPDPATGRLTTPADVCEWGTPPSNPDLNIAYCGMAYWLPPKGCGNPAGCPPLHQGPPVAVWTSKPTYVGGVFTMGHFVSPAGYCRRMDYPYAPTDFWWHVVSFHYWQCGGLGVETDFLAWVDFGGKTCMLPSNRGDFGLGAWQFQLASGVSDNWGGTLELMPELMSGTGLVTGTTWTQLAYQRSAAYLGPLPGDQPSSCFSSTG